MSERIKAAKAGKSVYKGNPCKYGHSGLRYVRNGACVECQQNYAKLYKASILEELKNAQKAAEG
jgi:hypothetical protein